MNLDELRSVQEAERRKDSLQHLRDDFYEAVAAYISDLKSSRDRRAEAVDQPFSDEQVRQLSDEIETAEDIVESLYERRVGKVVKLSSFAAADMPVEEQGMTSQEHELFCDLVDRIKHNKSTVLDVLAGEPTASASDSEPSSQATPPTSESASAPSADTKASAESVLADAMSAGRDTTATPADAVDGSESEPAAEAGPAPSSAEAGPAPSSAEPSASADGGTGADANTAGDTGAKGGADASPPASDNNGSPGTIDSADSTKTPDTAHDDVPPDVPIDTVERSTQSETDRSVGNPEVDPAPVSDGGSTETDGDADRRRTLRITEDVGSILGVDEREYTLRADDVVQLPELNATPLLERNAAEPID